MFFSPRKRSRRSSVGIEQLEVRIVPTITVHQTGTHLFIDGDSNGVKANDNVTISMTADGGQGDIDVAHDGQTEPFTGVDDITVSTGKGKDTVTVDGIDIMGTLIINTGTGQDTVTVKNTSMDVRRIGGDLVVDTGTASDKVTLDNIDVTGKTNVKLGDHKDKLTVRNSTFDGDFFADGGNHSDKYVDDGGNTFTGSKVIKHFQHVS